MVPAAPAARVAANSPIGWARWWVPVGASITGKLISSPRTVVVRSRSPPPTKTRGRSFTASIAVTLLVLVVQSGAPRSPNNRSNNAFGMVSRARAS